MDNQNPQSFWQGSAKSMFLMGLFLGLAIAAVAGLILVLSMVMSGKAIAAGTNKPVVTAPVNTAPDNTNTNTPPAKPVKDVSATDHIRGNKNAKVTLIEYSDFECPFCKNFVATLDQALKDFPNDVRLVFRQYPLSFHPNAEMDAEVSECVAKIGGEAAFWKFHDKIYADTAANGSSFTEDQLMAMVKGLGVNDAAVKKCTDAGDMKARVAADTASGNDSGVEGTPALFINGKQDGRGAIPYTLLKPVLQTAGATK